MKNNLLNLNNYLYAELERLGDETLKGDELKAEIERARAVSTVSQQIISSGHLALKAQEMIGEYNTAKDVKVPKYLQAINEDC